MYSLGFEVTGMNTVPIEIAQARLRFLTSNGAGKRSRTPDLRITNQYVPIVESFGILPKDSLLTTCKAKLDTSHLTIIRVAKSRIAPGLGIR